MAQKEIIVDGIEGFSEVKKRILWQYVYPTLHIKFWMLSGSQINDPSWAFLVSKNILQSIYFKFKEVLLSMGLLPGNPIEFLEGLNHDESSDSPKRCY